MDNFIFPVEISRLPLDIVKLDGPAGSTKNSRSQSELWRVCRVCDQTKNLKGSRTIESSAVNVSSAARGSQRLKSVVAVVAFDCS